MQLNSKTTSGERLSTCPIENPYAVQTKNPGQIIRETSRKLRETYIPNPRNEKQLEIIREQLETLFKSSSDESKTIPSRTNTRTNQYSTK
jgi:hypothetical protein